MSGKKPDYEPERLVITGGIELAMKLTGKKKSAIYKLTSTKTIPFHKAFAKAAV